SNNHFPSLLSGLLDKPGTDLSLLLAHHRPEISLTAHWVTNPEFPGHFHEGWEKPVLHLIVKVDSLRADAGLSAVPESRPDSTSQGPGQVCVVPDDKGRLSP